MAIDIRERYYTGTPHLPSQWVFYREGRLDTTLSPWCKLVLSEYASGKTRRDIASDHNISSVVVYNIFYEIRARLQAANNVQAVAIALARGDIALFIHDGHVRVLPATARSVPQPAIVTLSEPKHGG